MMKRLIAVFAVMLIVNLGFTQITGQEIMEKVYNLPTGNEQQGKLTMTLTNKGGEQRERKLQQYIKKYGTDEKKVMFFLAPADVRGTSFMNWSYADGRDDDQWIYLPALKRTKRISSDSKSDSFMGSDFNYDDLGDRHPSEDLHKLLREESVGGKACYVVESTPKNDDYTYSKTISWIMKDNYIGIQREFYDEDGKLLKKLLVKKYDKIDGFWIILETEMSNVQKNHKTEMKFENILLNQGINDSKFTERGMTLGS